MARPVEGVWGALERFGVALGGLRPALIPRVEGGRGEGFVPGTVPLGLGAAFGGATFFRGLTLTSFWLVGPPGARDLSKGTRMEEG